MNNTILCHADLQNTKHSKKLSIQSEGEKNLVSKESAKSRVMARDVPLLHNNVPLLDRKERCDQKVRQHQP